MTNMVSIIIPTLNEAENIEECLRSIKKQGFKNTEIIVVDNYSKDETLKIAKKYTPGCYLKGPERSSQRNFGAKKARGDYLLFLDADMQLSKKAIIEGLSKIQKGKYIIAFPELSKGENFWGKAIALERNLYQKEKILAAARLFPKDIFAKLRGFDEKLVSGEDWDLTIRAQKHNYKLVFTKNKIVHLEKSPKLKEILKKKSYYSANIASYARKHPKVFSRQSDPLIRFGVYLRNLPRLLKDPVHSFGFLVLKTMVWHGWHKNSKRIFKKNER